MIVSNSIMTILSITESVKAFMRFVGKCSQTTNNSLVGTLMSTLTTIKFDSSHIMHENIINMINIVIRLKNLRMVMNENFLVQFI